MTYMQRCALWARHAHQLDLSPLRHSACTYHHHHHASVRMRSEAYGRHFVCVCVCSERICFIRGLWAKASVSRDIIPCFLSLQFADLQNKASFLRYGNIFYLIMRNLPST